VVRGIESTVCEGEDCAGFGGGFGVSAHEGAQVTVTRFELEELALCGVVVAGFAELDLAGGSVSGVPIGACVQVPDYDVTRLASRVEYRDVGIPLQATSYALPPAL
jgi:hypothetical protein